MRVGPNPLRHGAMDRQQFRAIEHGERMMRGRHAAKGNRGHECRTGTARLEQALDAQHEIPPLILFSHVYQLHNFTSIDWPTADSTAGPAAASGPGARAVC